MRTFRTHGALILSTTLKSKRVSSMNQSPSAPPTKKSPEKDGFEMKKAPWYMRRRQCLIWRWLTDAQASEVFEHERWDRVVHLIDVPCC